MAAVSDAEVRVVGPAGDYLGKQGLTYAMGITSEAAGTHGICLTSLTIPPGARARVHYHEDIETVAYILDGELVLWYGVQVERRVRVRAGEYLYVPANVPHAPENDGPLPCRAVVGHSAGDDQAGIMMLPELDERLAALVR